MVIAALVLMIIGWVLLFLQVLRLLPLGFFISMSAFVLVVVGLFMGLVGLLSLTIAGRD